MKISLIEPLGVPVETIEQLAANIRAAGHEFVHFEDKASDASEQLRRSQGSEVVMIANSPLPSEDVSKSVQVIGSVDVKTVGIYHLDYIYTNADGVKTTRSREIIVADPSVKTDIFGKYIGIEGTQRLSTL